MVYDTIVATLAWLSTFVGGLRLFLTCIQARVARRAAPATVRLLERKINIASIACLYFQAGFLRSLVQGRNSSPAQPILHSNKRTVSGFIQDHGKTLSHRPQQAAASMISSAAALRQIEVGRRGTIAILVAMTMPVLLMVVGMGIEVTYWTVVSLELQRTADLAAIAGALDYTLGRNAQRAAIASASLAEINGAAGEMGRIWSTDSQKLTDNLITVQIGAGIQNNNNLGVKVTVAELVPLYLTKLMSSSSSITVTATGWSEVQSLSQPCVVALDPGGQGVTAQGNPRLNLTQCTVRSNAAIRTGGSASISAPDLFANGTITSYGSSVINGTEHPNKGTIPDPFGTYAPIQNAFAQVLSASGTSFSDNPKAVTTLSPGAYSGWNITGKVTLLPGIYYVNGNISLGSQASLSSGSGTGITIVTSGTFLMNAGAALEISAATITGTTNGAIPGVVFASNSSTGMSFGGNASTLMTGLIYDPNADVMFGGTAQGGGSGCLELIARSVTLQGNSSMASNCSAYGTTIYSNDKAPSVKLVQ